MIKITDRITIANFVNNLHLHGIEKQIFELIFKHGGFLSGGSARDAFSISVPCSPLFPYVSKEEIRNYDDAKLRVSSMNLTRIKNYWEDAKLKYAQEGHDISKFLNTTDPIRVFSARKSMGKSMDHTWKAGSKDKDIFFPSQAKFQSFWNEFEKNVKMGLYSNKVITLPTPANFGVDIVLIDCNTIIQIIEKNTGSIEEVLTGFDILNAQIAWDGQAIYMLDDKWVERESHGILAYNPSRIESNNSLFRLHKWYNNRKYLEFDDYTRKIIIKEAEKAWQLAYNGERKMWDRSVGTHTIKSILMQQGRHLPASELIKLAYIFNYDTNEYYTKANEYSIFPLGSQWKTFVEISAKYEKYLNEKAKNKKA